MDTQNTPIHLTLWHREFWFLALANMLVSMSVYMTIPDMIASLRAFGFPPLQVGAVMGVYGIGLFVFGPFVNYYVERYRRKMVCIMALLILLADMGVLFYLRETPYAAVFEVQATLRFVLGAAYGLFEMVLLSTLVIDTVKSFMRTEANHHVTWFGRFALSLGPVAGICICGYWGTQTLILTSVGFSVVAFCLLAMVSVPFKTPDDAARRFALDRFFLPEGCLLFFNLFAVTTVVGLLLTLPLSLTFFAVMMFGFLLALLSERFVFANAELESEPICGLGALFASLLILLTRHQPVADMMAAALLGLGVGLIGSRFLLFFIKLSHHCQRGTSQSTFFLGWESGISCGLFIGLSCFSLQPHALLLCGLSIIAAAFVGYHFFVHAWYMRHRNR